MNSFHAGGQKALKQALEEELQAKIITIESSGLSFEEKANSVKN